VATLSAAIAVAGPLEFVGNLPGIFNVQQSQQYISPNADAVQDSITVTATVTRNSSWTVKFFKVGNPTPVQTFSGTTADVLVAYGQNDGDGDYTFRIEATEPVTLIPANPKFGTFIVDTVAPAAAITAPFDGQVVGGLNVAIKGTATDANFESFKVEVFPLATPAQLMTLNSGTVQKVNQFLAPFNAAAAANAAYGFTLTVDDLAGNTATSTVNIAVSNATPFDTAAPQVSITSPTDGAAVSGIVSVAVTATDNVGIASVILIVDGKPVGVDSTFPYEFMLDTQTLANGARTLVAQAQDATGYVTNSAPVTVTVSNTIQAFSVAPNPFSPNNDGFDDQALFTAQFPGLSSFGLTIETIDGGIFVVNPSDDSVTPTPLPPGTIIRMFAGSVSALALPWDGKNTIGQTVIPGTYKATLTVGGFQSSLVVIVSGQAPVPVLDIVSPKRFGDVRGVAKILGTAANLTGWTLKLLSDAGDDLFTIASSTDPVVNGELGTLDTTLLQNDFYKLHLLATTATGQLYELFVEINVVGEAKVGAFTLTFQDLAVPVQGIPITVTRTYDTRLADTGDFGAGWRLDVVAGDIKQRANKDVMATLPDGRRTRFLFKPIGATDSLNEFTQSFFAGGAPQVFSPYVTVNYEPESTNTRWRLSTQGNQDLLAIPSQVVTVNTSFGPVPQVVSADYFNYDFTPWNPTGFTVTDQFGVTYDYTLAGRLTKVTEPNGNFLTITDTAITHSTGKTVQIVREVGTNRITKLIDPDAKEVNYTYNFDGRLFKSADREAKETKYFYVASGRLETIFAPSGVQAVKNEYDPVTGRLISHTDADGKKIEFDHQVAASQEVVTDRRGNVSVIGYDEAGNVLFQTNALGQTKHFGYDAPGNTISEIDELGRETKSTFDDRANLLTRTDPLGHMMAFKYNERGQVVETTDPLGHKTVSVFDVDGNLISTTDALGNLSFNAYDFSGRLIASTDALGTRTEFDYDLSGNVSEQRVKSSGGTLLRKATFTFDGNNRQITQTVWKDVGGTFVSFATTTTEYDNDGRVRKVFDPLGFFTETQYNDNGQQQFVFDKLGNQTEFVHDDQGRLEKTIFPVILVGGSPVAPEEVSGFDEEGNRVTFKDRNGNTTTTAFDSGNRAFKVTNADGSFRTTDFDSAGRVSGETNERGYTSIFGYDLAGRRTSVTDALGKTTVFELDDAGRQISVTDALQHKTQFVFDAVGRQVKTIWADGTFRSVEFDAIGRRVAETDEIGLVTKFEYLATGELAKVLQPAPANAALFTTVTEYKYDSLGQKIEQIDALGRSTKFEYTVRNELAKRTRPLLQFESFTYDAQGNLKTRTNFALETASYDYNALNQLTQKNFPDGGMHKIGYTAGGQRAGWTITPFGGSPETTSLAYDTRNRLLSQTNPDGIAISWGYDEASNRTKVETSFQAVTYSFTARNELHQVFKDGTLWAEYAYDAVGNRASLTYVNGTKATYSYNSKNQLLELKNARKLAGTTLTNYLQDPDLVSAWSLDEAGAPFADDKGASNLGAQGATAMPSAAGRFGKAVTFGANATDFLSTSPSSISASKPFPSTKGTLVLFYKQTAAPASGQEADLFTTREENQLGVTRHKCAVNSSNQLVMSDSEGFSSATSGAQTFSATGFNALAFRWNSPAANLAIFNDGAQVANAFAAFGSFDPTVNKFVMGNNPAGTDGGTNGFGARGTIDEVALFGRDLTNAEISDIAARGLLPAFEEVFSSYTYTVDARGMRTKVVEHDGRTVEYAYDFLKPLTQEKITEGAQVTIFDYTLDLVGNRSQKKTTKPGPIVEMIDYTYNANDELLTEAGPTGTTTYTYTANGETGSKAAPSESVSYSWDNDSRLVGAVSTVQGTMSFTYDVDGIRTAKSVAGTLTKFVVDKNRDFTQVIEERSAANTVLIAYVRGDDLLSQENPGLAVQLQQHFYEADGHGSTRQLTSASADVTDAYAFDAFGVTLVATGSTANDFLYSGEQLDSQVGSYYLRARYLSQSIGRFLSTDPFSGVEQEPKSLHKYLYGLGNPAHFSDPSGLFTLIELLVVITIIAILAAIVVSGLFRARDNARLRRLDLGAAEALKANAAAGSKQPSLTGRDVQASAATDKVQARIQGWRDTQSLSYYDTGTENADVGPAGVRVRWDLNDPDAVAFVVYYAAIRDLQGWASSKQALAEAWWLAIQTVYVRRAREENSDIESRWSTGPEKQLLADVKDLLSAASGPAFIAKIQARYPLSGDAPGYKAVDAIRWGYLLTNGPK